MSQKLSNEASEALSYFKEHAEYKPDQSKETKNLHDLLMSSSIFTNCSIDLDKTRVTGNIKPKRSNICLKILMSLKKFKKTSNLCLRILMPLKKSLHLQLKPKNV